MPILPFECHAVFPLKCSLRMLEAKYLPFLKMFFDQPLQTGKLPDDRVEAIPVAPVFKIGIGTLRRTTDRYPSHVIPHMCLITRTHHL